MLRQCKSSSVEQAQGEPSMLMPFFTFIEESMFDNPVLNKHAWNF